jgi:Timeless protein
MIVQLVVTFFRNLLAVPDARATDGARGDHRTRLRGELLRRLVDDHVLELLLVFAQHTDEVGPGLALCMTARHAASLPHRAARWHLFASTRMICICSTMMMQT